MEAEKGQKDKGSFHSLHALPFWQDGPPAFTLPCLAITSCHFPSPAKSPSASNVELISLFLPETNVYDLCKGFYVNG